MSSDSRPTGYITTRIKYLEIKLEAPAGEDIQNLVTNQFRFSCSWVYRERNKPVHEELLLALTFNLNNEVPCFFFLVLRKELFAVASFLFPGT